MANRRRVVNGPFEGILNGLLIEVVAFLVAYTVAKAIGWVD